MAIPARWVQLQEAFKLALGVTLFYWLALALNWPSPKNGVIAIAVTSLATEGESLSKGLLRILRRKAGASEIGVDPLIWNHERLRHALQAL